MNCPNHDDLERFALGFTVDDSAAQSHVRVCDACAANVRNLQAEHDVLSQAAKQIKLPTIGRSRTVAPWKWSAMAAVVLLGLVGFFGWPNLKQAPLDEAAVAMDTRAQKAQLKDDFRRRDGAASGAHEDMYRSDHRESGDNESQYDSLSGGGGAGRMAGAPKQPDKQGYRGLKGESPTTTLSPVTGAPAPPPVGGTKPPADPRAQPPTTPSGKRLDGKESPDMIHEKLAPNPELDTAKQTLSTFALDVDTASYTVARKYLMEHGQLPPAEAIRVEEFLNFFRYDDEPPTNGPTFAIRLETAPSPFAADRHLLRIGIKAKEIPAKERKAMMLTMVVDVSGSMQEDGRLELVKKALHFLIDKLHDNDKVGVALFSSHARKVLDYTRVKQKEDIYAVIDALRPEQSTNTEAGLKLGYEMAASVYDPEYTNRVFLCTDGVANVGEVRPTQIAQNLKRDLGKKEVFLTCIGVGAKNFNDMFLEKLADNADGNYAYVDTLAAAKSMMSEKILSNLEVVAKDAKVQTEFDPNTVASFRLVGYENRAMANEDFRNDTKDAGEVGAGHHVTAIYEIALKPGTKGRVVTVRIRYKEPITNEAIEAEQAIGTPQVIMNLKDASASFHLASAVMGLAEILRDSPRAKDISMAAVLEHAQAAATAMDKTPEVQELVKMIEKAKELRK